LDILEHALRLVSCFAARTAQRPDPTNTNFIVPKPRLWKFAIAEGMGSPQAPFTDLKSILSSQVTVPPNWHGYYFHYYKRAPSSSLSAAPIPARSAANTYSPITPTQKPRDGEGQKTSDAGSVSDVKAAEGWVRLYISPEVVAEEGIEPVFREMVAQASIPKDEQFKLFVQILIAHYYNNAADRQQFLRCQLYAISSLGMSFSTVLIVANVCDSHAMEKTLFNARPDLVQQLVRLLHNDSEAGINLRTIVLKTLRTLARNSVYASNRRSEHSRFHQILNAVDASLNHGILMTLLRENVTYMQNNDPCADHLQYAQALQRLIREFLESPQGAQNLGFAGVVPTLVDILKIERSSVWQIVVTVADLLGTLLPHQRHNGLFPHFVETDGLAAVMRAIKVCPF
jgi:Domain of Unknown Function (DUF908)